MTRVVRWCAVAILLAPASAAAQPQGAAHREALKKLDFLAGKWQGPATVTFGTEKTVKQTEDVQFKLNGPVLLIEGTGREKAAGKDEETVVFNALAVVSYDPEGKGYRIKAYTIGRPGGGRRADPAGEGEGIRLGVQGPVAERPGPVRHDPDRQGRVA